MHKETITFYNRRAPAYEAKWEKYLAHTHSAFLNRIETTAGDTILDASCGTGMLAQQLIEGGYPFDHLTLNDPSEQMLSITRGRLPDRPHLSFSNHLAEELCYDHRFDRIFCLNSFHFYTSHQQVLDQFYKMLKPGGRLYLLDWNREGFFRIINQIIKLGTAANINTRSLPELKGMLSNSGFRLHSPEAWSWRYWKFLYIEGSKLK